ncbi:glycosyltransferase [candidate division WOR-3 bacterium]|nr:glycosyltransferase [candidate division WOR-3 bacterium]
MKTIYFLDFALNRGGAEISLENLIHVLKSDYKISLILNDSSKIRSNSKTTYIKINKTMNYAKRGSFISLFAYKYFFFLALKIGYKKVIISNTFKAHITAMAMRILFGSKWIMIERDIVTGTIEGILKKIMYILANKTVFVSEFAKKANKGKGIVIYNIIKECGELKSIENRNSYIYAGDLTMDKGMDRIEEMFSAIGNEFPEMEFIIIGKKPEYDIDKVSITFPKNVKLKGYVNDPYNYYKRSRFIFLLNRRPESFSRVIAEAMACGVIPFVLKGNGTDDYVIHDYNGIILDEYNMGDIVKHIGLMKNKNTIKYLSENAIKTSKQFNSEIVKKKWLKILG